jgi:uncharacterized protein (DUF2147 family)
MISGFTIATCCCCNLLVVSIPQAPLSLWDDVRVSDDAKAWLYSVYKDGKWDVVSGDSKVAYSDTIPVVSLSKSGNAYGALVARGQESVLILSGKEQVFPAAPTRDLRLSGE